MVSWYASRRGPSASAPKRVWPVPTMAARGARPAWVLVNDLLSRELLRAIKPGESELTEEGPYVIGVTGASGAPIAARVPQTLRTPDVEHVVTSCCPARRP